MAVQDQNGNKPSSEFRLLPRLSRSSEAQQIEPAVGDLSNDGGQSTAHPCVIIPNMVTALEYNRRKERVERRAYQRNLKMKRVILTSLSLQLFAKRQATLPEISRRFYLLVLNTFVSFITHLRQTRTLNPSQLEITYPLVLWGSSIIISFASDF